MLTMPPLRDVFVDLEIGNESTSSFNSTIPVSEPSSSRRNGNGMRRKHKKVTFNSSPEIKLIKSHTEISERQKRLVWYSSEESKEIRNNAIKTVRKMANKQPLDSDETSRGLETKTPFEHRARRDYIQRTIFIVLREQGRELLNRWGSDDSIDSSGDGSFDYEYVAALYRHNSRQVVSEAIKLAAMDAEEVWGL